METRPHPGRDTMRAGRRDDVLRLLRELDRPASIAEVASRLGIHANTARFHLDNLARLGQVRRADPDQRGPGRPPLMFAAVHGMDPTGPRAYQVLAQALLTELASGPDPARRATDAGRAWATQLARSVPDQGQPVAHLLELLEELGFAPELTAPAEPDSPGSIALHHCPFLELATSDPEVVCPVHLGLMRGVLESWRAPVRVKRLQPFVRPDLCVAHLAKAGT